MKRLPGAGYLQRQFLKGSASRIAGEQLHRKIVSSFVDASPGTIVSNLCHRVLSTHFETGFAGLAQLVLHFRDKLF